MRGFTGITLISLLLISCTRDLQSEYELKILHLNPENAKSEINDAIKEISYLKLSTDNKSYIGTISKLLIEDDKIFVLDGEQALAIFVFAMDGELLYKIDAYGSGPGEFRGPRDIGINKENNTIIVYDMASIKLSYYKLDNGTYMHEKILPFAPSRFATSNYGYVFFNNNSISGEDEFNLSITDTGFQFIEKALPINPNLRGFFYNTPRNFTRYGNQLFFTQPFDNTVYKVDSNKVN